MSGAATGWVLRHGPRPNGLDSTGKPYGTARARAMRAVLTSIADAANRDGDHAHPGLAAIVDQTLYSRRTVIDTIALLVADGWVTIEDPGRGRGKAAVYAVDMGRTKGAATAPLTEGKGAEFAEKRCSTDPEKVQNPPEKVQSPYADRDTTVYSNGKTSTVKANARVRDSDERVDWQLPEVVARAGFLDAALELCDHWASRLEDRGVKVGRRARSKTWVAPMEALLRIDERDAGHVRRVIDWLEDGRGEIAAFWQGNVLSPAKLRARWDQIGQQVRRERTRRPATPQDRTMSLLLDDIERDSS